MLFLYTAARKKTVNAPFCFVNTGQSSLVADSSGSFRGLGRTADSIWKPSTRAEKGRQELETATFLASY